MVRNGRERRCEERSARSSIEERGGRRSIEERGGRSSNDKERGGRRRNENQGNAIMPGIALVRDRFAGVGLVRNRLRHCMLKVAMPTRKAPLRSSLRSPLRSRLSAWSPSASFRAFLSYVLHMLLNSD